MEVAVAFGDLRPELADDLHHRLDPQTVDFDGRQLDRTADSASFIGLAVKLFAHLQQRVHPHFPLLALAGANLLGHPFRQVFVILERLAIAQHVCTACPSTSAKTASVLPFSTS